jgi:transposase
VADAYGVNIRTVFRWLAASAYTSGGQTALQARPTLSRPSKLTGEQMSWLAGSVRDHKPQQYKFAFASWPPGLISELIEQRFTVSLSRSAVGRVMHTLGFTAQRPLYPAVQRDAVLVERWQNQEFPAIAAEAKHVGTTILFADEASILSDYQASTTWAPMGKTPVVKATDRRFSLNMPSAVSATGQFRFMVDEGSATAKIFLELLKRLMHDAKRPVLLVVDGHQIHKATIAKGYVADQSVA